MKSQHSTHRAESDSEESFASLHSDDVDASEDEANDEPSIIDNPTKKE